MSARGCNVGECPYRHHAKGFCTTHYHHWRKWGDPLAVNPFPRRKPWRPKILREPMDEWERRRVGRLLDQGMSLRAIQRATGINYMTVQRFRKKRELVLA